MGSCSWPSVTEWRVGVARWLGSRLDPSRRSSFASLAARLVRDHSDLVVYRRRWVVESGSMTAARGDAAPGQSNMSASVPPEGPRLLDALGFSLPAGQRREIGRA